MNEENKQELDDRVLQDLLAAGYCLDEADCPKTGRKYYDPETGEVLEN